MWGTFIVDAYFDSDRERMADALEEICSPRDDYGFASGVYCSWNVMVGTAPTARAATP